MSNRQKLLVVALIMVLCLLPFFLKTSSGKGAFVGTDGQAQSLVKNIAPSYRPWFSPRFEPPSGEIEALLFSLQAAFGAGVIGYYLGYHRRKQEEKA